MWMRHPLLLVLLLARCVHAAEPPPQVALRPADGAVEVLFDGKVVAAYLTADDVSTPARANETYKPYLRVVDPLDGQAITKGPGGTYTHHRGIFFGWMRVGLEGQRLDLWSMGSGRQVHKGFAQQKSEAGSARLVSTIDWNDKKGRLILSEVRTLELSPLTAPGFLRVDFLTTVKAEAGDLALEADPEHGGVHYRAPQEVEAAKTSYFFPVAKPAPHKDVDYPWVGMTYVLGPKTFGVVELDHPSNPRGTRWSAYRDYARFGAYPHANLKKGETLSLKYRFLVAKGGLVPTEVIQAEQAAFTGAKPEPVTVTELKAEVTPPPKAKK
jgi:hypothetical protein